MKVTMLSKEVIVPSSATPSDLKTYKLSNIDQQISPRHYPLILYYSYDESTNVTQSQMTTKLKTSLSKTLTHFYPLAGRYTKNLNAIDCTDQGVLFVEARVEYDLMNFVTSPVMEDLNQLVILGSSYVKEELLAIQVNLFECGGIAVGVSISHKVADGCSLSSFVSHWFAMSKGPESPLVGPVLDSAMLFPPVDSYETSRPAPKIDPFKNLIMKRFAFSSLAIKELKHKVVKADTTVVDPTRVEVVTALIWKCMRAVSHSVAFHSINLRRKMEPSLQDEQFGNLLQVASAVAHLGEDMACLVEKLRESFRKIDSEYSKSLMGENGVEIVRGNFEEVRKYLAQEGEAVYRFSSWCRFSINESDFGWGMPVWISIANHYNENLITFMDSRRDDGIEAWVVMSEDNMHKFEQDNELQAFLGYTTC